MEKVGSAVVRSSCRHLCGRHTEPHSARSRDHVRHDDMVAAGMVAPGVGHDLHCGFHAERDLAGTAVARVGLLATGKNADSRTSNLGGFAVSGALNFANRRRRWSANLRTYGFGRDGSHHGDFLAAGASRLGTKSKIQRLESGRFCGDVGLHRTNVSCSSCGLGAYREVRNAGSFTSGVDWRVATTSFVVALGWIGAQPAWRVRTADGLERQIRERDGIADAGASLLSRRAAKFVHRSGPPFTGSAKGFVVRAVSRDAISQGR